MESFGLLVGHLVGDYVLQDDYQARGKKESHLVCLEHCVAYTAAVWLASFWWLPLWALPAVLVSHFLIDRWRAVAWAMDALGQEGFRTRLGPWSVIVVDNVWHVVILFLLQALALAAGSAPQEPTLAGLVPPLLLVLLSLGVVLERARRAQAQLQEDADGRLVSTGAGEYEADAAEAEAPPTPVFPAAVSVMSDSVRYTQALVRSRRDNRAYRLYLRVGETRDLAALDPRQYRIDMVIDPECLTPADALWLGELHLRAAWAAESDDTLAGADLSWLDAPVPVPPGGNSSESVAVTVMRSRDAGSTVEQPLTEVISLRVGYLEDIAKVDALKHTVIGFAPSTAIVTSPLERVWWHALNDHLQRCLPRNVQPISFLPADMPDEPLLLPNGSVITALLTNQDALVSVACVPGRDGEDAVRGFSSDVISFSGRLCRRDSAWVMRTLGVLLETLN